MSPRSLGGVAEKQAESRARPRRGAGSDASGSQEGCDCRPSGMRLVRIVKSAEERSRLRCTTPSPPPMRPRRALSCAPPPRATSSCPSACAPLRCAIATASLPFHGSRLATPPTPLHGGRTRRSSKSSCVTPAGLANARREDLLESKLSDYCAPTHAVGQKVRSMLSAAKSMARCNTVPPPCTGPVQ